MYKCLLIGSVPPPYHGSNIYFKNLIESELKNKFHIFHLDTSDHRSADNLSRLDIINVWLAVKHLTIFWFLLIKIKPHLVYVPIAPSFLPYLRDGLFILSASYLSRAKIVVHLHRGRDFRDNFYEKSIPPVKWFIRFSLGKAYTGLVLGEGLKTNLSGLIERIESVPNGLKTSALPAECKKESQTNEVRIGYLGNLLETKGIRELAEAAFQITKEYPQVRFLIAGPWRSTADKIRAEIEQKLKISGAQDKIKFIGAITSDEKKYRFLCQLDAFVLPSWMEGFPLTILEAMACCLPVIATNVGAVPEVIENGVTGLIVSVKNTDQLSFALRTLINDEKKRKTMGTAAKKRFEQFYTMDKNIKRMTEIFNNILSS